MKRTLIITAALLALAACAKEEITTTEEATPPSEELSGTATGNLLLISPVFTKVTDTSFEDNDQIGVTISYTSSGTYVTNSLLTYSDEVFSGELEWYDGSETCDITAYYPYQSSGIPESFSVQADQSVGTSSSEFLVGSASEVSPSDSTITVEFSHLLSKITVNISNLTSDPVSTVTLDGTRLTATVDVESASVTVDETVETEAITLYPSTEDATYEAIIVPQTAALKLGITTQSDRTISKSYVSTTLQGGYEYTINVTINEEESTVTYITDTITTSTSGVTATNGYAAWTTVTGSSGATYEGYSNCNSSYNAIALRSSDSTSGMVTTSSPGIVTEVSVTWNESASSVNTGKSVTIYGSNTAYESTTNLFSADSCGTSLGTISYPDTLLSITGEYSYIGIRSTSGNLHLDGIYITWAVTGSSDTDTDEDDGIVDDTFTYSNIGVTGTSYVDWADTLTLSSGAKYWGHTAAVDSTITLRSSSTNGYTGIICTKSAGLVKGVSVEWSSKNDSDKSITVYGNTNAYTSIDTIFTGSSGSTGYGKNLGTITYGTSTSLDIDGDYSYVAIRSTSGVVYLDSITITWDTSSASAE